jgi:hypothetical protein
MDSVAQVSLVFTIIVVTVLLLLLNAEIVRPLLRRRRAKVRDSETVASGRAVLRDGRCFEIPIVLPGGPAQVRLFFDPVPAGDGREPRFAVDRGTVRVVHRDGAGILLYIFGPYSRVIHLAFVFVVDPSTGTPSLLRVPPGIMRARQAVAWTFGMDERDWTPVLET